MKKCDLWPITFCYLLLATYSKLHLKQISYWNLHPFSNNKSKRKVKNCIVLHSWKILLRPKIPHFYGQIVKKCNLGAITFCYLLHATYLKIRLKQISYWNLHPFSNYTRKSKVKNCIVSHSWKISFRPKIHHFHGRIVKKCDLWPITFCYLLLATYSKLHLKQISYWNLHPFSNNKTKRKVKNCRRQPWLVKAPCAALPSWNCCDVTSDFATWSCHNIVNTPRKMVDFYLAYLSSYWSQTWCVN